MIEAIIDNANSDCTYREFCAFFMDKTFRMIHGSKYDHDDELLDQLLLACHRITQPTRMVAILRHAFSRRMYLDNWHRLRDHCYTGILALEGQYRASRVLAGLFEEVNNAVTGSKRKFVPYYWGPRFYNRIPSGCRPNDAENKVS